jgi:hypothetical protein
MPHGKQQEERRRAPRAYASCDAKIVSSGGRHFTARAEDVGTTGCRVVAPEPLARGALLRVLLASDHGEVDLLGSVAWASEVAPWRIGIRFAPPSIAVAKAWFERFAAAGAPPPDAGCTAADPSAT